MYAIRNHSLYLYDDPVEYQQSPNFTNDFELKPEGILLHDTAGRLDGKSSINWFLNPAAVASAHLVVHRTGQITQLVAFNRKAWHAGISSLNRRAGVNDFSIGIEIVNPGKLTSLGGGRYQAWFGKIYRDVEYTIVEQSSIEHGSGSWMSYTTEQLDVIEQLCVFLFQELHLEWVWPHWKVSPGRKVDTNPLFPLQHLQSKVAGRSNNEESSGMALANSNQRRWPSYKDNVIQVIPRGERVEIIRSGWYQNGDENAQWFLVSYKGHEGWVHESLIEL